MLVLLERDNFGVNSAISLTSYAVVCSNVVWSLLWTTTGARWVGVLEYGQYGAPL